MKEQELRWPQNGEICFFSRNLSCKVFVLTSFTAQLLPKLHKGALINEPLTLLASPPPLLHFAEHHSPAPLRRSLLIEKCHKGAFRNK